MRDAGTTPRAGLAAPLARALAALLTSVVDTPVDGLARGDLTARRALLVVSAGEVPVGLLGDRLGLRGGSATAVVDRLARAGLAERSRPSGDRRLVTVSLTPVGRRQEERLVAALAEEVHRATVPLSGPEVTGVGRFLAAWRAPGTVLRHRAR